MGPAHSWAGSIPDSKCSTRPVGSSTWSTCGGLLADPKFRNAFFEVPKSKGLIGVSLVVYGPSSFVSKQPLRSLADFRGKKIWVMGSPMQTTPIRQLGGTASPIAWAETLPALQQGMIDGVKSALPAFTSVKFYDAAKYLTATDELGACKRGPGEQNLVRPAPSRPPENHH